MRFSFIFYALPLVASNFAAPIVIELPALPAVPAVPAAPALPSIDLRSVPLPTDAILPVQDLDVVSIVTVLQTSIHAITAVGNTSTEVEVETFLQAVVLAFGECGAALGIDISLGVDVEINLDSLVAIDGELEIVAEILADVVETVHGLVGGLDSALCLLPTIASRHLCHVVRADPQAALLSKVDCAVGAIIIVLDHLLDGLFDLLSGLLGGVGLDLGGLFGGLMGAAKGGLGILGL